MKAKFFTAVLAILVSTMASAGIAGTAVCCGGVDSEQAARAFILREQVAQYWGYAGFTRVLGDGSKEHVTQEFRLGQDLRVTYLAIWVDDGPTVVVIDEGDKPLDGLPANEVGTATQFYLWLNAYDKAGYPVAYGGTETIPLLLPGDPIMVTLRPEWLEEFLSFQLPAGADVRDVVLWMGDRPTYYDEYRGGFSVWYDPLDDLDYEIVNMRTGERYQSGQIDVPAPAGDSLISVKLIGGVEEMFLDDNTFYSQQESLDGAVERDGEMVPAKVYMARPQGLNFYVSTSNGLGIEIRAVTESGEVVLVASNQESGNAWLYLPPGFDRVIVTITGDTAQDFYVWAERF